GLVLDSGRRLAQRERPAVGFAHRAQHVVAPRVDDQLGLVAVLLFRQDDGRGHHAVVEQAFDLAQTLLDKLPDLRGNFNVTACDIYSHVVASQLNTTPCVDSMSESSVPRGISRSCGAPASVLPSGGCSRSLSR